MATSKNMLGNQRVKEEPPLCREDWLSFKTLTYERDEESKRNKLDLARQYRRVGFQFEVEFRAHKRMAKERGASTTDAYHHAIDKMAAYLPTKDELDTGPGATYEEKQENLRDRYKRMKAIQPSHGLTREELDKMLSKKQSNRFRDVDWVLKHLRRRVDVMQFQPEEIPSLYAANLLDWAKDHETEFRLKFDVEMFKVEASQRVALADSGKSHAVHMQELVSAERRFRERCFVSDESEKAAVAAGMEDE